MDFDSTPDFVNAEGTKWWKHTDLQDYLVKPDRNGVSITDLYAWYIQTISGERSFVITTNDGFWAVDQSLEAIATKIDVLKFLKYDHSKEQ